MEFSRQEHWILPDPRIETLSPATPTWQGRFFTTAPPGKPHRRPKILRKPCEQICWHLGFVVGEGNGAPLQYSCLENPMDRGAWWAAVHGVAKSQTRLSTFTFTFHFHALEKEMATHSSVLAWKIPGMGEPWWAAIYGVTQSQTQLRRLSSCSSRLCCFIYIAQAKLI